MAERRSPVPPFTRETAIEKVRKAEVPPPSGFNRGFFSDPKVDQLLDAAALSTDDQQRRALYGDVQRAVAEDAPYISLWCKTNVAVARADLSGIHLMPIADFTFLKDVSRTQTARRAAR